MSSLRSQLLEDGYAVVPDVVPVTLCDAVIDAIGEFLGLDPRDPAGVMNARAAQWWLERVERMPLTTEPFLPTGGGGSDGD